MLQIPLSPLWRRIVWIRTRAFCFLLGCWTSEYPCCERCGTAVYDEDFRHPGPGTILFWRLRQLHRSVRERMAHRCAVCSRWMPLSVESCCSPRCYDRWMPF